MTAPDQPHVTRYELWHEGEANPVETHSVVDPAVPDWPAKPMVRPLDYPVGCYWKRIEPNGTVTRRWATNGARDND